MQVGGTPVVGGPPPSFYRTRTYRTFSSGMGSSGLKYLILRCEICSTPRQEDTPCTFRIYEASRKRFSQFER